MTDADDRSGELNSTGYEIFIALLSILSIVNIVLLIAIDDPNLTSVLHAMNVVFSVVFLGDFTLRLLKAGSKSRYFFREFGWADLLASLPFEQAKILRVFRLLRVVRLLRASGTRNIARSLIRDRAGSALYLLLIMGILVLEFGSLAVLQIEQNAAEANITTGSDAIWYVLVTISTVGYGDQFPVTNAGRFLGAFIIVIGVGIFGTFTGYLANFFLSPSRKTAAPETPSADVDVRSKVAELRGLIARQQSQQQAAMDEIEELLSSERR
jgi:voltage-gated potassium channel